MEFKKVNIHLNTKQAQFYYLARKAQFPVDATSPFYTSKLFMISFMNNYLSYLVINNIRQINVIKAMNRRGYHKFSRNFFNNCLKGWVYDPPIDILINLCEVVNKDLLFILSLNYDYNDFKPKKRGKYC